MNRDYFIYYGGFEDVRACVHSSFILKYRHINRSLPSSVLWANTPLYWAAGFSLSIRPLCLVLWSGRISGSRAFRPLSALLSTLVWSTVYRKQTAKFTLQFKNLDHLFCPVQCPHLQNVSVYPPKICYCQCMGHGGSDCQTKFSIHQCGVTIGQLNALAPNSRHIKHSLYKNWAKRVGLLWVWFSSRAKYNTRK